MASQAGNVVKIGGALVLAAGLCWWWVPPAVKILDRPHTVASGARPLIVVSTAGGTTDQALDVSMTGGIGTDLTVRMNLRTLDEKHTDYEQVETRVTIFGPERDGAVACQGESAKLRPWADLGEGAQTAFDVDEVSTYAGAHPLGKASEDVLSAKSFPQWTGHVSTVTGSTDEDGRKNAALECVVPASWVWAMGSARASGLLPQINYNAVDGRTDFQAQVNATTAIDRDPGWVLDESYPESTVDAYSIRQTLNQYWVGKRGEHANLAYTSQPDLLLAARDTGQDDAKTLTVAGIVLGIAGSLVVSALSRIVDVLLYPSRRRRDSAAAEE
ncbi:hypothetical protein LWP59_10430 [Amycolatopsis acidiphila]|uniref:Uncharacterized protein n=1 Tax=Amycolatopsis acidiphila TaxID=715473 RepID=A0A558A4J8_9PSEU|nr:hypothetical protein [Amycolatopsis acidiphila]TVT19189.1 hypothetical protein FNH06_25105 [Amycolatopsis acidiphila]UIJ62005.1 hypothetical protein LWP59_10430 [Amycolatopsis acidiphila]GHG56681.1 hypothetical protein GCM10017788_07640 [Amycolatopsis acidiphila]